MGAWVLINGIWYKLVERPYVATLTQFLSIEHYLFMILSIWQILKMKFLRKWMYFRLFHD